MSCDPKCRSGGFDKSAWLDGFGRSEVPILANSGLFRVFSNRNMVYDDSQVSDGVKVIPNVFHGPQASFDPTLENPSMDFDNVCV